MTPEEFTQMKEDVRAIKEAVVGNESIGLTGLVKRVIKLETAYRRLDVRIAMFCGCAVGGWFVIEHLFFK